MIIVKTSMEKIPKCCEDCKLLYEESYGDLFCGGAGEGFGYIPYCRLPSPPPHWCPLEEIEEKKT